MSYCTVEGIVGILGEEEIQRLTNLETDYEVRVQLAIDFADSLINGYLFNRQKIDENNIPVIINKISTELAIVILAENYYRFTEMPNSLIRQKRACISQLEDIAKGKISMFDNLPNSSIHFISNKIMEKEEN